MLAHADVLPKASMWRLVHPRSMYAFALAMTIWLGLCPWPGRGEGVDAFNQPSRLEAHMKLPGRGLHQCRRRSVYVRRNMTSSVL